MITRRTYVNKRKHVTCLTTGIRGRCEIIYTQPTADTGSLAGVSLQTGVLGLNTVCQGDRPPNAWWGNGPQWSLVGKQKRQRSKVLKITQRMFQRRSYRSIWQSVFFSLSLSFSFTRTPVLILSRNRVERVIFYKENFYGSFSYHSFVTAMYYFIRQ